MLRENSGKKPYLCNIVRINMSDLFWLPPQSNNSPKEEKSSINSLLLVLRNMTVLINGNLLHTTVKMGTLRLRLPRVYLITFLEEYVSLSFSNFRWPFYLWLVHEGCLLEVIQTWVQNVLLIVLWFIYSFLERLFPLMYRA